jgi:uncharacterized protein
MASEIFADTSGFYACLIKADASHGKAEAVLSAAADGLRRFVTTDYVLDETATLLKARGHGHLADALFDVVFASSACRVEWMDAKRFAAVRALFSKHGDHDYSFTDCFSFHTMKQLHLRDALTKDEHFREAGFIALLA